MPYTLAAASAVEVFWCLDLKCHCHSTPKTRRCANFCHFAHAPQVVEQLLGVPSCDPTLQDDDGNSALHAAAKGGFADVCRRLLSAGCPADALNAAGSTALFLAAAGGHADACRVLLEGGADPDIATASSGNTTLHAAAAKGAVDVITVLAGALLASGLGTEIAVHVGLVFLGAQSRASCYHTVRLQNMVTWVWGPRAGDAP